MKHQGISVTRAFLLLIVAFSNQALASDASEALVNAPIPDSATFEIVGLDMRQNGVLMSIATFRSSLSVDETLAFYRSSWAGRDENPGHLENRAGNWRIISRLRGDVNLVLQIQHGAHGGSEGLFSAVQLNDVTGSSNAIEMPPGGEVVSSTLKKDLGRTSNTWVIRTTSGTGYAAAFYQDTFERKRWRLVSDSTQSGVQVLRFNHPAGTAELAIQQAGDGSTLSILNRVDSND